MTIEGSPVVRGAAGRDGDPPDTEPGALLRQRPAEVEVPGTRALAGQAAARHDLRTYFIT
jgi:hypothetical protein